MKKKMNAFWEFCSGVRQALAPDSKSRRRPESPPPVYDYDCANFCCIRTTKDLSAWIEVKAGKKVFFFCSNECWDEWLQLPTAIAWSPVSYPHHVKKDPPALQLEK